VAPAAKGRLQQARAQAKAMAAKAMAEGASLFHTGQVLSDHQIS
jgi:hypothetical protein